MRNSPRLYVAIVDDDESVCRAFGRLLGASGMQPISYASAEDFLADAKQPRFDCLLLDIRMGGMSGIELARLLKERGSTVPFIFITASDEAECRVAAASLSCAAYLLKTDPGTEVVAAIRRAVT